MKILSRWVIAVLLALPTVAMSQAPPPAESELLRVRRYADDGGEGTLRWAIEINNQAPGRCRIEIEAVGRPPYVIKPASALPAILGPVRIEGVAWKRTGDYVAIDGSSYVGGGARACPGAVDARARRAGGADCRERERRRLAGARAGARRWPDMATALDAAWAWDLIARFV